MGKEAYVPLTLEIIEDWTLKAQTDAIAEREEKIERMLIPELRKELAVKEAQELEIMRMESEVDVMNLASEFVLRIKGGEYERAYNCFALDTPGVSAEITGLGVYEGKEALRSYYVDYLTKTAGDAGYFKMNHLAGPVVEVAKDNESARGMWMSVGMEALKRPDLKEGFTDPLCIWAIGPWCMEFVKENGAWKIWKLYVFNDIETTYEESWTEISDHRIPVDPDAPKPSKPSERHAPFTAERMPLLHAIPPVAYDTFKDGMGF